MIKTWSSSFKKLLGEDDIVSTFVCEGFYFCVVDFPVDIDALCFALQRQQEHQILCDDAGNPDPGSLDRENLRDFDRLESLSFGIPFQSH